MSLTFLSEDTFTRPSILFRLINSSILLSSSLRKFDSKRLSSSGLLPSRRPSLLLLDTSNALLTKGRITSRITKIATIATPIPSAIRISSSLVKPIIKISCTSSTSGIIFTKRIFSTSTTSPRLASYPTADLTRDVICSISSGVRLR